MPRGICLFLIFCFDMNQVLFRYSTITILSLHFVRRCTIFSMLVYACPSDDEDDVSDGDDSDVEYGDDGFCRPIFGFSAVSSTYSFSPLPIHSPLCPP